MSELDFEGTEVLERLAEVGRLQEFSDAIDADDLPRVAALMTLAGIDAATIVVVLRHLRDEDD